MQTLAGFPPKPKNQARLNAINTIIPTRQRVILIFVGLTCMLGYAYLARQSNQDGGIALFDFLASYWAIGVLVLGYWLYLRHHNLTPSYAAVIFWAVIFRLIGVAGSPMLEDDFYRYLLDGCVFIATGSPYGITPESLFHANSLSPECRDALTRVNNPDLPTIYAPLLQYVFALAHIIAPANIQPMQFILMLFDIGVILLLCRLTSAKNVLLYAWNPLLIKEIAFTAHPDIIGVFFLLAALTARQQRQSVYATTLIALACASKIIAILALPYFLYKQPLRHCLLVVGIWVVLYLPFLLQGSTDMTSLGIFAQHWQFNATAFQLIRNFLPDLMARSMCLGLFVMWWGYYFYRYERAAHGGQIPRFDWIFGIFFLLAPVANPWYMVWLLPFAAMRPSCWAWVLPLAISLTYVSGINLLESNFNADEIAAYEIAAYEIADWAYALEIIVIGAALFYDYRKKIRFSTD